MRAMQVSRAGGPFEAVERPLPEPAPGWVRIRIEACGICHSDAFIKEGGFPGLAYPRIPGHEVAGLIDKLGDRVDGWAVGQRVGVGWHGGHCGVCDRCQRGDFLNCRKGLVCGIHYDGGYAEAMCAPVSALARIPDDLSAVEAAPLLCAGITTFNALRHAGAKAGGLVAVQGIGGLGHLAIQFSRRMGYRTVALTRGADKDALARQLGAHEVIDAAATDPAAALRAMGGADVILATAPHSAAMAAVIGGLAPRGQLVVVAASFEPMPVVPAMLLSGKAIRGWPSGTAQDSEDTMAFSSLAAIRPMIETYPLAQAEAAYARMMANQARFRVVLTMG